MTSPTRWLRRPRLRLIRSRTRDLGDLEDALELRTELADERETTRRLREVDELKNSYIASAAHDMRNPLAAVLALASILSSDTGKLSAEKRSRCLETLAEAARRADESLTDLVEISRLMTADVSLQCHEFDLASVVEDVLGSTPGLSRRPCHKDLEPVVVQADESKMVRVLRNLLEDVLRQAPAGSPISVTVGARGPEAVLSVGGRGPGVPRKTSHNDIALARPDDRSAGGIGLFLLARFAECHGGRVEVSSGATRGRVVSLRLPLSEVRKQARRAGIGAAL